MSEGLARLERVVEQIRTVEEDRVRQKAILANMPHKPILKMRETDCVTIITIYQLLKSNPTEIAKNAGLNCADSLYGIARTDPMYTAKARRRYSDLLKEAADAIRQICNQ